MEKMADFLTILRTDRKREISGYRKRGYLVREGYRLVRKISIEDMEFGVQVSAQDYFFFLIGNNQNAYYSVYELYNLLHLMAVREGKDYVNSLLQKQIDSKYRCIFKYEDIEYEMKKSVIPDENEKIEVEDGSEQVDYKTLFILLNLIQEKSNSLFGSRRKNKDYKNGIIRLLITLIDVEQNNQILTEKGWVYDEEEKKFKYDGKTVQYKNNEKFKKYYLTKGEKDSIMSIES
ncbi:MAG: hypothetical protein ACTTKP_08790 [Catonella sp.]|uniref:hypothetical protein n=1 Tax=Catonella sp. TaxID=2382125 RepID=UPI003FA04F75